MTQELFIIKQYYDFLIGSSITTQNSKKFINSFLIGLKLLKKSSKNFRHTNSGMILSIIKNHPNKTSDLILTFRILLGISRMNLETYFVQYLITKGVLNLKVKSSGLGVDYYDSTNNKIKQPDYDQILKYVENNKEIRKALIDFFIESGLQQALKDLKSKNLPNILKLSESLFGYSEKGALAEGSGAEAEKIIKKKLQRWGLEEDVHYNKNDSSQHVQDICKRTINQLKQNKKLSLTETAKKLKLIESKKKKLGAKRQFDLVFPPYGIPKLLIQIEFSTSNTGSKASKKVSQNIQTEDFILNELKLKNLKFEYISDGPGMIQMLGNLKKYIEKGKYLLQINSVDTRLKKMLNEIGFVYPIDVDIAILELEQLGKDTAMKAVLEKMATKDHLNTTKEEIKKQNCAYFENKSDDDIIKKTLDPKITKQFLVLEKIMYCDTESNDETAFYLVGSKVPYPSPSAVKDELKKLNFKDDEIDHYIEKLKSEGTLQSLSRNNS